MSQTPLYPPGHILYIEQTGKPFYWLAGAAILLAGRRHDPIGQQELRSYWAAGAVILLAGRSCDSIGQQEL